MKAEAQYVILSPVCNEADHIDALADSVFRQTCRPGAWIIIDDGSTDTTMEKMRRRCRGKDWIYIISGPPKAYVGLDGGEDWAAMRRAFPVLGGLEHSYVAKLDGDVLPESHYFEQLLWHCAERPAVGIVSGACWEKSGDQDFLRRTIFGSCWPCARLYRRECFSDINEHPAALGWDMLHVLRARARGWKVEALLSPRFQHLRAMGSRGGVLQGKARAGRTSYLLGYSRAYFGIRLLYEVVQPPRVCGSAAMLYGYLRSAVRRECLIVAAPEKREMRRMQTQALRTWFFLRHGGKRGYQATAIGE